MNRNYHTSERIRQWLPVNCCTFVAITANDCPLCHLFHRQVISNNHPQIILNLLVHDDDDDAGAVNNDDDDDNNDDEDDDDDDDHLLNECAMQAGGASPQFDQWREQAELAITVIALDDDADYDDDDDDANDDDDDDDDDNGNEADNSDNDDSYDDDDGHDEEENKQSSAEQLMLSSSSHWQSLAPQDTPVALIQKLPCKTLGYQMCLFSSLWTLKIVLHLFLLINDFLEASFPQPNTQPPLLLPGAAEIGPGWSLLLKIIHSKNCSLKKLWNYSFKENIH